MEIKDFIIGVIIFALATSIILGAAYEIYSENGLNITMDNETSELFNDFESTSDETYGDMVSFSEDFQGKVPGGTDVGEDTLRDDDDYGLASGVSALSSIPTSYTAVKNILGVTQSKFRQYVDPRFMTALGVFIVISLSLILLSVWTRIK